MRRPLVSRIVGLTALYFTVFIVLVLLQFSKKGNFSLISGAMTIRGRYLQLSDNKTGLDEQALTGGVKIFFGGLEFELKENSRKGLLLIDIDDDIIPVNPNYMTVSENTARFGLPGGTSLVFSSFDSARGPELHISAEFAEDVLEVTIPIAQRRSSLVHDNEQLGIVYNGSRYTFGRSGHELENGKLTFSRENAAIAYRSMGKQRGFDPSDYAVAQSRNSRDYENALTLWRDQSYAYWSQNASALQNESDVTAYCAEALRRGSYLTVTAAVSRDFLNSSVHGYRSSEFLGGMARAFRLFSEMEREKTEYVTRLVKEGSLEFLKEDHIIDFLLARNNAALADEAINVIRNADIEQFIPDYCAGLLEAHTDFKNLRQPGENPIDRLTDQILSLISENLHRDNEKDAVYFSLSGSRNYQFNLRLGKALLIWAEAAGKNEWAAIGRSLILSALPGAGADSGELYCVLKPGNYNPRAVPLTAALSAGGSWAWTVSPSISAAYQEGDVNLTVSFPENMTHYIIVRGVRPFIKIQIHGIDFRSDSQFERYDSSGWVYYSQEQALILKLKHREIVENVKIVYRAERPPVVVVEPASDTGTTAAGETVDS